MPTGDRKLDEFESMFRSAVREGFQLERPPVELALLVTDAADAGELLGHAKRLLAGIDGAEQVTWTTLSRGDWIDGHDDPLATLLAKLEAAPPHLLVTHRHLLEREQPAAYSLGSVVDTLTQVTSVPVLLLPSPTRADLAAIVRGTQRVLVVTDHLQGDDALVNWGVKMTDRAGTLFLAHVEDDSTLARYLEVIGRIRTLDSEEAATELPRKLLEAPTRYIERITEVLHEHRIDETVVPLVRMGHALTDYRRLVEEHDIDLLIFNTQDEHQVAMSGMAYALAVELRHRPLLLV